MIWWSLSTLACAPFAGRKGGGRQTESWKVNGGCRSPQPSPCTCGGKRAQLMGICPSPAPHAPSPRHLTAPLQRNMHHRRVTWLPLSSATCTIAASPDCPSPAQHAPSPRHLTAPVQHHMHHRRVTWQSCSKHTSATQCFCLFVGLCLLVCCCFVFLQNTLLWRMTDQIIVGKA